VSTKRERERERERERKRRKRFQVEQSIQEKTIRKPHKKWYEGANYDDKDTDGIPEEDCERSERIVKE
jgi:hypothetical protein